MRIMGVDPGSQIAGFAIIQVIEGKFHHLSSGSIVLTKAETIEQRLKNLYEDLSLLVQKYQPTEFAIEDIFFAKNAKSSLKLGQARGIALLVAAEAGLSVAEYSPTQIKSSIAGAGRADKAQIEHMIRLLMKLPKEFEFHSPDHSDALAICLTHGQTKRSQLAYDRTTFRKDRSQNADELDH